MSLARLSAVPTDTSRPTAHPPAGRSAHPSVHPSSGPHIPDGPDSDRQAPDHRRGDRIRPVGAVSFRALRAIAAGLARVEQPLPVDLAGDGPRSSRLIATAFYDVWLITWPDGSGLEPHDHGDVRSVLQVVDGEITEVYRDRRANLEPASRVLGQGSVTLAEPTVVHSLRNRSGAEATTLHVYSPPPGRRVRGGAVDPGGRHPRPGHVGRRGGPRAPAAEPGAAVTSTGSRSRRLRPCSKGSPSTPYR